MRYGAVSSEGGPAKWLKNKNHSNHHCDYEPGGREFDNFAAGEVGRRGAAAAGRSVAEAERRLPRAISPGAPINQELVRRETGKE
jgi:hypothetical protein